MPRQCLYIVSLLTMAFMEAPTVAMKALSKVKASLTLACLPSRHNGHMASSRPEGWCKNKLPGLTYELCGQPPAVKGNQIQLCD